MSTDTLAGRFGYGPIFPIPIRDAEPDKHANYLSAESVSISGLHWFTSDLDIVKAARKAGVSILLDDVVFAEHKVNGKSKCMVTVNCRSPEKASKLVQWFANNECQGKKFHATYVTNGSNKPNGSTPGYGTPRPLANLGITGSFATNAHGGINFNRLRPHNRHVGQPISHIPVLPAIAASPPAPQTVVDRAAVASPEPDWMHQWYSTDSGYVMHPVRTT